MRNLKKFLALVLAMMMAMSLMVTANAATQNVTYPDDYLVDPAFEEAVTVLSGMGVFHGDNGDFKPSDSITRAETAAIIYRLVTGDVNDTKADLFRNVSHPFADVTPDKWYAGYVGYLWNAGIIKGANGSFNPASNVTGYEALAMILRAVGYDKQNEFTGGNWVINVASIAQNKGILKDVETTNYGGPQLYSAARRDVVASLLFRTAAYVPQVMYTSAFQYQEYGMTSDRTIGSSLIGGATNPTLGETWFGLTKNYGVVLGNEATGEGKDVTKIGFELDYTTAGDAFFTDNISSVSSKDSDRPNPAYIYGNSSETSTEKEAHWTGSFKWDTGLDFFGHGVKVWYDNRDSSNIDTYAVYDQARTAIVSAQDSSINGSGDGLYDAVTERDTPMLENNWKAPALKVYQTSASDSIHGSATNVAFFNYAFSRMDVNQWGSDAGSSWKSPIKTNNGRSVDVDEDGTGDVTDWPLYLLISNGDDMLDMVVSLDMTFTQIVQVNTTTGTNSVGVRNENGAGSVYFGESSTDAGDDAVFDSSLSTVGTNASYVNLATANLVKSPNTARGTKVAAIEITGTTGDNTGLGSNNGNAKAKAPLASTFYYQLTQPTHVVPGTVVRIDRVNQDVYLSDGSVLRKSVLSEAVDGTFKQPSNGKDYVMAPTIYKTYSFTLDNDGRYIYWEESTEESNFVYGTYIDYYTELASSSFVYPLVFVDANGQAKQQANVTKINGHNIDVSVYGGTKLNKRDTSGGGNTSGYAKGMYVGYALSEKGELTEVTSAPNDTGFLRGTSTDFGNNGNKIEIDAASLAIGSEGFGTTSTSSKAYFLTENTQFYIVDGAGMDNQSVKPYKGINELMAGMSKVTIDATTSAKLENVPGMFLDATSNVTSPSLGASGWEAGSGTYHPYDLIYYSLSPFNYAQSYNNSAREIETVYIPKDLIEFTPAVEGSLYFVGNSASSIINAYGEDATLFTMYQNGQEVQRWIAGLYTNSDQVRGEYVSDAYIVEQTGDNVFYTLKPTMGKAKDGGIIYEIETVSKPDTKIVGQYWDGDRTATNTDFTNEYNTTTPLSNHVYYTPTTYSTQIGYLSENPKRGSSGDYSQLYNVGNAVVKNADIYSPYTIENLTDLNNAGSLADNYGVEVSCVLDSADANNLTVSYIYINVPTAPGP